MYFRIEFRELEMELDIVFLLLGEIFVEILSSVFFGLWFWGI